MINLNIPFFNTLLALRRGGKQDVEPNLNRYRASKNSVRPPKTTNVQSTSKLNIARVMCEYCEAETSDGHKIGFEDFRFFAQSKELSKEEIATIVSSRIAESVREATKRLSLNSILHGRVEFVQFVADILNQKVADVDVTCAASGIRDIFIDSQIDNYKKGIK